jgi:hypothetical protein
MGRGILVTQALLDQIGWKVEGSRFGSTSKKTPGTVASATT